MYIDTRQPILGVFGLLWPREDSASVGPGYGLFYTNDKARRTERFFYGCIDAVCGSRHVTAVAPEYDSRRQQAEQIRGSSGAVGKISVGISVGIYQLRTQYFQKFKIHLKILRCDRMLVVVVDPVAT